MIENKINPFFKTFVSNLTNVSINWEINTSLINLILFNHLPSIQ